MKRKFLEGLSVLQATDRMLEAARNDRGTLKENRHWWSGGVKRWMEYKHYLYFRATDVTGILQVSVFRRRDLAAGDKCPAYCIYLDKKERTFLTREMKSGKWRTAKLDYLDDLYDEYGYRSGAAPYSSDHTLKTVADYTGYQMDVKSAVLRWQNDVRKEELEGRHRRETDRIDEDMNLVPELPKDFGSWVNKEVFLSKRYLFYRPEHLDKGWCSFCQQNVSLAERPYLNHHGKCPSCGSVVIYKTYRSQKVIRDESKCAILQPMKDRKRYVMREFYAKKTYRQEEGYVPEVYYYETARKILDNNIYLQQEYEWQEYKNTGIERWCYAASHYYLYRYHTHFVFYHRNLKKLRKNIPSLKYLPIEELFRENRGTQLPIYSIIGSCIRHPRYEYLIKLGLIRFTIDQCMDSPMVHINETARKPWDMLGIRQEDFSVVRYGDYGDKLIRMMQMEKRSGVHMTDKERRWMLKYCGVSELINKMPYTTPHKMIRYLHENLKIDREGGSCKPSDYLDYLKDLNFLGIELSEDVLFPKNFEAEHRARSEERACIEDQRKNLEKEEKNKKLRQLIPQWEELYGYEDKQFIVLFPHDYGELSAEGRHQHHCVATYFDLVVNQSCVIAFIRKKDQPMESYCTVELRGTEIRQSRMKYNKNPPLECENFLRKWKQVIERRETRRKQRCAVMAG